MWPVPSGFTVSVPDTVCVPTKKPPMLSVPLPLKRPSLFALAVPMAFAGANWKFGGPVGGNGFGNVK
jgi:hypothetical protein